MNKDAPDNPEVARSKRRTSRAEAAAWIVRLHGPHRTPELEAGCRAWLAESAENEAQFESVTDIWEAASSRPEAGIPRMARWSPASRRWSIAAMLVVAIGIVATLGLKFWSYPSYSTEIGEQRIVRLVDGTRVTMNSGTKLSIAFTAPKRRVRLDRGEAFFEVAHDLQRPFVVVAGDRQVTALGTTFDVSYDSNRTAVTLVEGQVSVVAVGTAAPTLAAPERAKPTTSAGMIFEAGALILSPGERITFSRRSAPKLDEPTLDAVTAWRRGEVVLDKTPLVEAVAEMNRYETTRLIIEDPSTAGLRVSGIYHAGDSTGFARTVAELYGLDVTHEGGQIRLRAK
jgi:transmembrane sensor